MKSLSHRSFLFVPGDRSERFSKACAAGADGVILDLEDAVSASNKASARDHVERFASSSQVVFVRINGAQSAWFADDLRMCRDHRHIAGIVLPKAEDPEVLREIQSALTRPTLLLPIIESARGLAQVRAVASAPSVQRLLFGSVDFQLDLGILGDGDELMFARSQLVLASRLAGLIPPVDGVTVTIGNMEQLRSDVKRARNFGFGGKLCIHPNQVEAVNEGFNPAPVEVAWAEKVLQAYGSGRGTVNMEGEMIDLPVALRAQAIVDSVKARAWRPQAAAAQSREGIKQ